MNNIRTLKLKQLGGIQPSLIFIIYTCAFPAGKCVWWKEACLASKSTNLVDSALNSLFQNIVIVLVPLFPIICGQRRQHIFICCETWTYCGQHNKLKRSPLTYYHMWLHKPNIHSFPGLLSEISGSRFTSYLWTLSFQHLVLGRWCTVQCVYQRALSLKTWLPAAGGKQWGELWKWTQVVGCKEWWVEVNCRAR